MRVVPRARKSAIAGVHDDALLVRLAAPPVDGAANDTLVEFFADRLHLPRHAVRIVSGLRSRKKRIALAGVTAAFVRESLL